MRARTVVIVFCLVLSFFPCFATSSNKNKRKLSYAQVAVYGLVAASMNAAVSTIIASYYADLVRQTNPNAVQTKAARDVLEFVDEKINQELTSRGLGEVGLDELD